jgi:fatty-acid desaturase
LNWIALSWGIGMGYHRLHTHRGYKCSKRSSTSPRFARLWRSKAGRFSG